MGLVDEKACVQCMGKVRDVRVGSSLYSNNPGVSMGNHRLNLIA